MKAVFFDFNGTLLDDMPVWHNAMSQTFRAFGVEPPSIPLYFTKLEEFDGDYQRVYEYFGITAPRKEINAIYQPTYASMMDETSFFEDASSTLATLDAHGKILVLITTQNDFLVTPFLKKIDVEKYFHICKFSVYDKAETMKKIMSDLGLKPSDCCAVGDAPSDLRHAERAGVLPVAFISGYIPDELLIRDGVKSIRSLHELLEIV